MYRGGAATGYFLRDRLLGISVGLGIGSNLMLHKPFLSRKATLFLLCLRFQRA